MRKKNDGREKKQILNTLISLYCEIEAKGARTHTYTRVWKWEKTQPHAIFKRMRM